MLVGMHLDSAHPSTFQNKLILAGNDSQYLDCTDAGFGLYMTGFDTQHVASIHVLEYNPYNESFKLRVIDGAGTVCYSPNVRAHFFTDWLQSMDKDDHMQQQYKVVPAHFSTGDSVQFCAIMLLALLLLLWIVERNV